MIEKPWYIPEDAITDWSANPLAAGGFGEVFTASYYGAPVAVKQLYRGYNQNELADFGREIGIWHKLTHPHVLPLLGACDTTAKPFMVSPFMPNGTLHSHFSATEPRPYGEKIRLLYQVASGMAYLHGNNIVHGDLKSLNVLLDGSSNAVVTDFGMARTKYTSATANRTRRDQPTGGTLDYMAPEMLDDDDPMGSSITTDIYAFGITMYEVLNDCKPIWVTADGQPMRPTAIERQVLRGNRPKRLDDIPDDIRALIERCWHQDPAMRPKFPEILAILRQSTEISPIQDVVQRPTIIAPRRLESFQPILEASTATVHARVAYQR
ncbi:kinase-like domain-containing protein [Polychytrium aggregatum]|uniref:kinase-like domain-containing protein n=1 Tax=Polychytrium aggregatum TaxID=110093 RepID=UPI0022FF238C|nr:kinase-like domain-containing protein [Polychytrium aggregatum]KAI9203820.1 kinase-like domain-containing protein [Polychytrium aggregatum]